MKTFTRDTDGEPSIWWHWQTLGDNRAGFCTNGRVWLHFPGNSLEFEWYLGARKFGLTATFSDIDDNAITIGIKFPFIGSFYFSVENAKWVKHLPGVKWTGTWGSGEREIGVTVHDATLWIHPWIHQDGRWWAFNFPDFFLGRDKYSDRTVETGTVEVELPEAVYSATYRLFESTWTRPRWPWPRRLLRGEIEVEGGIPVPGKGENSWDCEDTTIYSLVCVADTPGELAERLRAAVLRRREKYGWRNRD